MTTYGARGNITRRKTRTSGLGWPNRIRRYCLMVMTNRIAYMQLSKPIMGWKMKLLIDAIKIITPPTILAIL